MAAAGGEPADGYPLDGVDLSEVLTGKSTVVDRTFVWRTRRASAVRSGKWKYLKEGKTEYLFDLSVDEREQADFKDAEPAILQRMRKDLEQWQTKVLDYPAA